MSGQPQKLGIEDSFADPGTTALLSTSLAFFGFDVSKMATGGAGTIASPWTGWEVALNALPAYSHAHFPAGIYTQTVKISLKAGWHLTGDSNGAAYPPGVSGGSYIISAIAGTAIEYAGANQRLNIRVTGLSLYNSNAANKGSGILLRLGGYADIDGVNVYGFKFGVTILGCTRWTVQNSTFEFYHKIGIYVARGNDYNGVLTDTDYSATDYSFQSDNGVVRSNNFNNINGGATIVCEAQNGLAIESNKFTGDDVAVWIAASNAIEIFGSNTFEGQVLDPIQAQVTSYLSGGALGVSGGINLYGCRGSNSYLTPGFHLFSAHGGVIGSATLIGNVWDNGTQVTATMVGNAAANINTLVGINNSSGTADFADTIPARAFIVSMGDVNSDVIIAGRTIRYISNGLPARSGALTLGGGGAVTVGNAAVTASTQVVLTLTAVSGTLGSPIVTTNPGVGFTVTSTNAADRSTYFFHFVETQ